jgi:hypothetical protein
MRQWCERRGLKVWHCEHMLRVLSRPMAFRTSSGGTADCGMAPGSVKEVLAWEARESEHKTVYTIAADAGIPPVSASMIIVTAEYPEVEAREKILGQRERKRYEGCR